MNPVLVLRHGDDIPLGLLGEVLEAEGIPVREVMLHAGDPIPDLDEAAGLVVLGGKMGAYDVDVHPWLKEEKEAIAEAHRADMPMLGICLGVQLFADALGGSAHLADGPPEIGHFVPEVNEAGESDQVLREFDAPVVVFHQDTFEPPPGATLLASSERFPHAFRLGSAVALQAHPEADAEIVAKWVAKPSSQDKMARAGVDPDELMAAIVEGEPAQREMARRLFGAWIDELRAAD